MKIELIGQGSGQHHWLFTSLINSCYTAVPNVINTLSLLKPTADLLSLFLTQEKWWLSKNCRYDVFNESNVHFFKKPIPFETFSLEIEHQKYVQANILNYARLELTYSDIYKCMQPNMPEVDIYKHRDTERNTLFHFSNSISILFL